MPNWEEINAQKRLQEERAKLRVSAGTSVQRITSDAPPRPTFLSDHKPSNPRPETAVGDPLALVSNGSPVGSPLKSAPKTTQKRSRQLLKIRLEHADNAMNIVENWRLERQAAPKVVKAIQLLAAIEAGNVDYVRENYPMLVEALQKPQKRRATPSLKESDSYIERESAKAEIQNVEPTVEQIAEAIQTITGRDRHLNRDVYGLAGELHQLDYTALDVNVWQQRCWKTSWPGDKGDAPTLKQVRERIGQVRNLPVEQQSQPEPNPYLDDAFFTRHTDSDLPPVEDRPVWPPSGCSVPPRLRDTWNLLHSQISGAIGWRGALHYLKDMKPIHYNADLGTLYVSTFRLYQKEWADQNWPDRNRQFSATLPNDQYLERMTVGKPGERQLRIEFIVEGDPVPGLDANEPLS